MVCGVASGLKIPIPCEHCRQRHDVDCRIGMMTHRRIIPHGGVISRTDLAQMRKYVMDRKEPTLPPAPELIATDAIVAYFL